MYSLHAAPVLLTKRWPPVSSQCAFMGLWRYIFGNEGESAHEDVLCDLTAVFQEEARLGRQIGEHAGRTPYPWMGELLHRLADGHERRAARLQKTLHALGRWVTQQDSETKVGKNNWTRLETDLRECVALGRRYAEQAIRWDPALPDVVEMLWAFEKEVAQERDHLRDLALRSDPLAID